MASSCLVLADEGSMSRLSSPHESSPCFVTLLLHLEVISSYRAAMFSLGKGVEGNGGASHLSSSSKPSLFPAPISLTSLSGKRCQLCWANSTGQLDKNVWEILLCWLAHTAIFFLPQPCPGGTFHSLPVSCPQAARKNIMVISLATGKSVLPQWVVWGRRESPCHCLMVPPFPAAAVVMSPVMFSISRPGAMAGWH